MLAYIGGLLSGQPELAASAVCGGQLPLGFPEQFLESAVRHSLLVRTDLLPADDPTNDVFVLEVELDAEEYIGLVEIRVTGGGSCIDRVTVPGAEWMWPADEEGGA